MGTGIYNGFVRGLRWTLGSTVMKDWRAVRKAENVGPAVYVVHHQNLRGPVRATVLLPEEARIWTLHVFCGRESCFRQYYDYTFTQRLGWPRFAAYAAARILSLAVPWFLRGLGAVPVFRGSREILRTMALSEQALLRGENLLICPDQDYASEEGGMGDIYKGFLHLERSYYKKTGTHLAFVPLAFDEAAKRMNIEEAVYFRGEAPFSREVQQVAEQLRSIINAEAASPCGSGQPQRKRLAAAEAAAGRGDSQENAPPPRPC